jgi:hypothetical protein
VGRRPLAIDERRTRIRVLAFLGALVLIVALVIGAVAVFGTFLERFAQP